MLIDTSTLLRTLQVRHPQHEIATRAFEVLAERGRDLHVVPQNLSAIYPAWEQLVVQYGVVGKPAHDARLVAAIQVHGLTTILTFDRTGFSRYAGIEVVHPNDLAT